MSDLITAPHLFSDRAEHSSDSQIHSVPGVACEVECAADLLTREQVVDRILSMNSTARTDFLDAFSDEALREYLSHLQSATVPRGPHARWVRRAGVRASAMADARA